MVAFVGKQDPHRHDGTPGLILTAAARFPLPVTDALLLFAEGASDRADGCDEASSAGTQELRAQEVQAGLDALWPGVRVTLADLRVDPSDARAVLRAVRAHPAAQAARADSDGVQTHLLVAGGRPPCARCSRRCTSRGFLETRAAGTHRTVAARCVKRCRWLRRPRCSRPCVRPCRSGSSAPPGFCCLNWATRSRRWPGRCWTSWPWNSRAIPRAR